MCGINGIFAYHYAANDVSLTELVRTRDHMAARGPDATGEWLSPERRVGFGHRRLSIIDLSEGGAQPKASADGQLTIVFNGEIYNYRDLKRRLEAEGAVFRSNSDTEVLLHLYERRGAAMVDELRGMYAFVIWDQRTHCLFSARDPFGIKPLYYVDDGWTFRFASQVKALVASGAVSRDPEPAGIVGFHLFGSVPEPFTTFAAIRSLPAGTTMTVGRTGAGEPRRFHSVGAAFATAPDHRPPKEADAEARVAFRDAVRAHLVADVSVGAFLSSGIDSGALVGLMRDVSGGVIETITVAFEEFSATRHDEAPLAAEVARRYGTSHEKRVVTRTEFNADLPKILAAMDQPSIDGINTWFVAKAARERGLKVAISGLGGDELLGGYPSFHDIPTWVRSFKYLTPVPGLGRAARTALRPLADMFGASPKSAGMLEFGGTYAGAYLLRRGLFLPSELPDVLDPDIVSAGMRRLAPLSLIASALDGCPDDAFAKVATLETSLYMRNQLLRDTDWASMAHGLEVRVPLVDVVLQRALAPMRARLRSDGKTILATAPSRPLPTSIIERRKTGFTIPMDTWLGEHVDAAGRGAAGARSRSHWSRDWSLAVRDSVRKQRCAELLP